MLHDPLSSFIWTGWIVTMLMALVLVGRESYRTRRGHRGLIDDSNAVRVIRWGLQLGVQPDESIVCQLHCRASIDDIMNEVKNLITFHRPCLQYPLSEHWWQLNYCDYRTATISAVLRYKEGVFNLSDRYGFKPVTIELVWTFRENLNGDVQVFLDWYRLVPWMTRFKHNILLSMCAYTEERIKKLNESDEQRIPAACSPVAAISSGAGGAPLIAHSLLSTSANQECESTSWPTPQDYNEAIQNPSSCFVDEQLKSGQVELNVLGMPKVASGAFASVYRLHCPERDFAVRCFLHPVKDQKLRYGILEKHLAKETTNSIIEFKYVDDGIKIHGKSFPILKMEWVDGPALHIYVEQCLGNKGEIARLRRAFEVMVCGLREAKIAHGDLQHGNIIVHDGNLMLVDYDGIFVPELVRFRSAELGHPNYQHPKRAGKHFGLFLDNFAGWLIDTSLLCLQEDSRLWERFAGGDECLLFRRTDLLRPDESDIFKHLREHGSDLVRESVSRFLSLLDMELEEIPFLEVQD